MNATDILSETFYVIIVISAAPLLSSMVVGLIMSIIQASTQIQDASLAFIPKVLVVFLSILWTSNFAIDTLTTFTIDLFSTISDYGR